MVSYDLTAPASRSPSAPPATATPPTPASRSAWRAVALPSEHGGWGLTAEPVLLGLLVAASWSGVLVGVAAVVAFLARTPTKIVLVDRWRHRQLDRTRLAARLAAAELVIIAAAIAGAAVLATGPFWVPLVAALPLVGVSLWFEMRSRGRRLVPELAGSVGISAVAASIVLADGGSPAIAAGVWLVLSARAVASVPFARYQVMRLRGRALPRWTSDVAQGAAVALAIIGCALGWLPLAVVAVVAAVAVLQAVLSRVTPPKAVVVGIQQTFIGLFVTVASAVAFALW